MPKTEATPVTSRSLVLLALTATLAVAPAQTEAPQTEAPKKPAAPAPHFLVRRYPQDKDVAIAVVGGRTLTLGDLVDHLDSRHHPGFREAVGTRPEIQRMLQSDLMAPWVRHFADMEALRQSLGEAPIDEEKLSAAQSTALQTAFQAYLNSYVEDRRAAGHTTEMSQQRVNSLLADYQLRQGMAAELQGWLDYLEPGDYTRGQMQVFFNNNARAFGGQVTIEHILVQNRDGGTGLLLGDEGLARASARLADIKARLRPDGSNFEDVARGFSDDTRTAREGGLLNGVRRFDDRLPASLCRAAWSLRDGEVSDVVESPYGWHIVKRVDFTQNIFILFTDDAIPSIRIVMRRSRQEQRLFDAREKAKLRLLL
ncbi:MAG TPA: peptidylprolyl isomerase [Planctomycetota bacterium]|nr:peptidylprolyl isomerase [Planctomycetota bacterium]